MYRSGDLEINFRLVGEGFRGGAQHAFPGKASPALGKHEQIKRSGGIGVAGIKIPGGVFYISLKIRRKQQGCQHAGEGSGVHHRRIGNTDRKVSRYRSEEHTSELQSLMRISY